MDEHYVDQVRLLLRVPPDIAAEEVFALKGGTAINLFFREMPRLSVDIDLAYLPVDEREKSLRDIDETLKRIVAAIGKRNPGVEAQRIAGGGNNDTRILVREGAVRVKVETSPVNRGTVCAPVTKRTSADIAERLTGDISTFLLRLHDAEPDFDLLGLPDAVNLPAVGWKLLNLEALKEKDPRKHGGQREALEALFQ